MSRGKKILLGFASACAIIVGIGVIHHLTLKGAVKRYRAELIAMGERLTIDECLPPSVPAETNSAALFLSVTTNFVYNGPLATNMGASMIPIAPGRAMVGWAQPWFGDGSVVWFSNSWEEAFIDLSRRDTELTRLAGITDQPVLQFETDYADGWFNAESLVQFLPGLKQAAKLLGAAGQCEMNRGNSARATQYVQAELTIIRGTTDSRWLITQLVRAAMAQISADSTWALLQSGNLAEAELTTLQAGWSSLEFIGAMGQAFEMELAMGMNAFQKTRESSQHFEKVAGHLFSLRLPPGQSEQETYFLGLRKVWARLKFHFASFIWRYWWSYSTEHEFLKQSQNGLEQCRAAAADGNGLRSLSIHKKFISENPIDETDASWGRRGFRGLRSLFVAPRGRALEKALRAEAAKQLTLTAIALQRYQLAHDTYPESLADLVPGFLAQLPVDPMDGEAVRYERLSEGGFSLYSVGDNRQDDGGDPGWTEQGSGRVEPPSGYFQVMDWVWPQHASKEEVLAHWAEEVTGNYARLFLPEDEVDPHGGVPYEALEAVINPVTGKPIQHSDTGRVMLSPDGESAGREWQERVERLAHQWTEQYFRTLTNALKSADDKNP